MKVVLFPSTDKPWDGIEAYSFELAKRLSKKGIEVVGIRIGIKNNVKAINDNFTLIDVKTPNFQGKLYALRILISSPKTLKIMENADIVHGIGGYYAGIELFPIGKKVVTIIGASSLRETSKIKRNFRRLYMYFIYKMASAYIVPNEIIMNEIKKYVKINPILIPLGIDIEGLKINESKSEIKAKFGFNDDDIIILYLGQLVKGKRLPELIRAFQIVLNKIPNSKLVLVAWGYLKDYLQSLVNELRLNGKVFFMNPLPYNQRKYIYSVSDVFVMLGDSFGDGGISSAVLDALGSGLPIVVSKNSPNYLVVKDGFNGYTVNPEDYNQVANAILKSIENGKELGKNSLYVAKNFEWDIVSNKTIELYETIYSSN
ncbi:glycosyl transferase group 1 [Sulfolobus islandicus Y.N.15.51]|uniref:Glycosyl transferase group 1 n=1 Tax=Saccharolobus islandicus (strain Y.N.15.51 / Yellowstone \|nr:glycosyltransferase family 4 protein [Sulfolobus islandicus]ACP49300.1 glycosyl transferase group 1 [Sulfolobus islandicus Y.N.15.51]